MKTRNQNEARGVFRFRYPVLVMLALVLAAAPLGQAGASLAPAATIHICPSGCDYPTIQEGLAHASPGNTLLVDPGTYSEVDKIFIDKIITFSGADPDNPPVLRPDRDTGSDAGSDRAWIIVAPGISFSLDHFILDGDGFNIMEAIQSHGSGLIESNTFRNLHYDLLDSTSDLQKSGTAIFLDQAATTVRNNLFENIGRIGVLACGPSAELTFSDNSYQGKGASDRLDVAAWVAGGASASIDHNTISNNSGGYLGLESAAIRVDSSTFVCQQAGTSSAEISNNTLLASAYGILVGASPSDASHISAANNRIAGNTTAGVLGNNIHVTQDAQHNWWGCNAGANQDPCDKALGTFRTQFPLQLNLSASPSTIDAGQSASVTASVTRDAGYVPDGTLISLQADRGSLPDSAPTSNGLAAANYTASSFAGTATLTATLDRQTVTTTVGVNGETYLPLGFKRFLINFIPFTNGGFDNGWQGWNYAKGPFMGHGSGLPSLVDSNPALLGDPNAQDDSIPVGYAFLAQTFTVRERYLDFDYHLETYDIFLGSGQQYFDTFEVSVNTPPNLISDADRNALGCVSPDAASPGVSAQNGLVFCAGGVGNTMILKDYGVQTLRLDLSAFVDHNITLYFALWSREYQPDFVNDQAYWNTWVTIDNVAPAP